MSDNEPTPHEEIWTFGGTRAIGDNKRQAWIPVGQESDGELVYPTDKGRAYLAIGGQYRVQVSRQTEGKRTVTTMHGTPVYAGEMHPDENYRARLELAHRSAETKLRLTAMARRDSRIKAIDDLLAPLEEVMRRAAGPDRDVLMVHVMRKLSRAY